MAGSAAVETACLDRLAVVPHRGRAWTSCVPEQRRVMPSDPPRRPTRGAYRRQRSGPHRDARCLTASGKPLACSTSASKRRTTRQDIRAAPFRRLARDQAFPSRGCCTQQAALNAHDAFHPHSRRRRSSIEPRRPWWRCGRHPVRRPCVDHRAETPTHAGIARGSATMAITRACVAWGLDGRTADRHPPTRDRMRACGIHGRAKRARSGGEAPRFASCWRQSRRPGRAEPLHRAVDQAGPGVAPHSSPLERAWPVTACLRVPWMLMRQWPVFRRLRVASTAGRGTAGPDDTARPVHA